MKTLTNCWVKIGVSINVHMSKIMRTLIKVGVRTYAKYANFRTLASFANMTSGGSQGGWFDAFENSINTIAWHPHRIKGILDSTLAAEAMALLKCQKKHLG